MRVAVLGAGLQGACLAMELALNGIEVDLYDKNESCLSQASAQNEGKIHLGYVYAKDTTLNTARLMIRGAVRFSGLMRRWIGTDIKRVPLSTPFYYAVHKESMISIEKVHSHLLACNAIAREARDAGNGDYFGIDHSQVPIRLGNYENFFDPSTIVAAFQTSEISIDPQTLCDSVRATLASEPKIHCRLRATVLDVLIDDKKVQVDYQISNEKFREGYDCVVNTLWDGRLAIDAKVGMRPQRPWLFRMKYYLRGDTSLFRSSIPTTTIVLGPFGDVVNYGNGGLYLSWYPAGVREMSSALHPPQWPRVLDELASVEVRESIWKELVKIIPALADLPPACKENCQVKGGVIFAWGSTDIHDPASELHTRTDIGPQSFGRYYSINTGKLTMAPLFAKIVADRIRAG